MPDTLEHPNSHNENHSPGSMTFPPLTLQLSMMLAWMAGMSIPMGALIYSNSRTRSICRRLELDSFMSYFGGGALMAAISLVLVPEGIRELSVSAASAAFAAGGLAFWGFSEWSRRTENSASNFMGMILDFVPESVLVGAAAAGGSSLAWLMAAMIAMQNMPEGFAAYPEMRKGRMSKVKTWTIFLLTPLLGPLAAWAGFTWLSAGPRTLSAVLLVCAGGILYLVFQDIAPRANLKYTGLPAIGAVSGFLMGMAGTMMAH